MRLLRLRALARITRIGAVQARIRICRKSAQEHPAGADRRGGLHRPAAGEPHTIEHVDYRRQDREAMRGISKAVRTLPAPARLADPICPSRRPCRSPISASSRNKSKLHHSSYDRQPVLIELKQGLRNASDPQNIRGLLKQLRARVRNLYASVAEEESTRCWWNRSRPDEREQRSRARRRVAPNASHFYSAGGCSPPRASARRARLARQIPPSSPTRDRQRAGRGRFPRREKILDEEHFSQAVTLSQHQQQDGSCRCKTTLARCTRAEERVSQQTRPKR